MNPTLLASTDDGCVGADDRTGTDQQLAIGDRASDYARMERAIRFVAEHQSDQPGLDEIAAAMGLSPWHAQRVFTRWAGVSPKQLLGLLTLEAAKARLREAESVLGAALDVGLSGPSRLHDLFVRIEAMTPGEYRALGAGLVMQWGVHATPYGNALVVTSERGLARLAFLAGGTLDGALAEAQADWPLSTFEHDARATERRVAAAFAPEASAEPLPLLLKGTPFQVQVWRALLKIPEGALVTYGSLARALGQPGASRAVGSACGRNRIGWLIPCHRVIRETGALGGYHWGLPMKQAMLAREAARTLPAGTGPA